MTQLKHRYLINIQYNKKAPLNGAFLFYIDIYKEIDPQWRK